LNELRARGVNVIAISMSRPETLARYLAARAMPIPMFADPDRRVYAELGLARTSWGKLLRPSIIWKYLKMIARGGKLRPVPTGEDALQLGGDFLVASDGRILWEYRSSDPTDRPTVDELLRVVREQVIDNRAAPTY
jgi:alkyl hydroperoxide reductase subunit AhpC